MNPNVPKRKIYPWSHPRIQTDMEYDDSDEFMDLRYYLSQRPNEDFSVQISRQMRNGYYCPLGIGHWEDYDFEDIKRLYGGGTYKLKFLDGKKRFLRTLVILIDLCFRGRLPVPNI